jgi:tape measure domain-containing protein
MADYDAKIRVSADTTDVDRKLSSLEKQLAQLNKKGGLTFDLKDSTKLNQIVTGFQNLQTRARAAGQDVLNLGNNFKNFGRLAATSGLGAAYLQINQLGVAASNAGSVFGPLNSLIKGFGAAAQAATPYGNAVIDAIKNIGITSGTTAAEIALATAAFMAFSPVLKRATVDTIEVAKAGITAGKAIGDLGKGAGVAALNAGLFVTNKKLNEALEPAENLRKLFQRQLDTRTELEKRVSAMNIVLNQHNAFSETGLKILEKTLELEQRLTRELNNQQAARRFVDPGAARKLQIEQRIAAIRRGEIGGNEAFREYSSRAAALSDAGTRDLYQRNAGVGKYAPKAPIANMPLALPSTELLDPVGRGIKRITEYSGEYTATLDKGVAAGQRFTQSLKQADTESLKLQGDLKALELVLSRVTNSLSNVGVRNQFAGKQVGPETRADYYQRIGIERKNAMMLADREAATEAKINAILEKRNTIRAKGGGFGKAASGALSNAAVGGAFPLLFGQSGAAATGGALGGVLGSVVPGIGGFGGSLIGTILGEKLGQGNQVKQLGEDIGFSAEQTKMLGTAFQQAGRDFDKFQQSVSTIQGLSLSIEDQARAIQLASSLTETYKGKIDKVTNAFAGALSSGKVTQGTINQLTNNGIPIQQALADKYNVSRSAIIQMAKDGKISVQDLIDTLVKVGNEGAKAAGTQKDVFADSFEQISKAVADFQTTASKAFKETGDALRVDLGGAVQAVTTYITDLIGGFGELARVAGPALDPIISGYINLEKAIFNAVGAVPALRDAVVQFALQVAGPLAGVVTLMNQIRSLGATAKGPEKMGPYVPERLKKPPLQSFIAPSQAVPSSKGSSEADKAAKAAEREAARVANIVRDQAALTQQKQLQAQYSQALFTAEVGKDEVLKIQLQREREIGEISLQYSKQINDEKAKGNSAAVKEAFTKTALVDVQLVELKTAQQLAELQIKTTEAYTNVIDDLDYQLQLKTAVTEQDRIQLQLAYEAAKLKKDNPQLTQEQIDNITKKKADLAAPKTDAQTIAGRVGQLQDEIKEMTKLSTIAITSADGIGTAFANSFKSLIDGSMSAREALSNFFKDVASMFLDMAAQIIAKQMTMIILQSILKALGAVAGAAGGATPTPGATPQMTPGAIVTPSGFSGQFAGMAAKGAYFSNGVAAFANGGIVGSPTMFRFANGGTTQTGLMGEAGPEAIMPLSRGAGGKLGVNASGLREAMGGAPGMGGSPVLNMSFETTRFGDTDYVSRDQLEAAMAQTRRDASRDGAKRGMNMTLDRLQQSPQTRNRVGLR